jgi:hypothetical protein
MGTKTHKIPQRITPLLAPFDQVMDLQILQ